MCQHKDSKITTDPSAASSTETKDNETQVNLPADDQSWEPTYRDESQELSALFSKCS